MTSHTQIERQGRVTVLRLNRPDRGNALDTEVTEELCEALTAIGKDSDARGVVVTGAGRIFCAGGDVRTLAEWRKLDHSGRVQKYRDSQRVVMALQTCPLPVVAALNGPAAGAGVDLALACDLRIAVPGASFSAAFAKVGLVPDLGGSWFLARRVPRHAALKFLLGGQKMPASAAAELGLLDQVLDREDGLVEAACALIGEITQDVPRPVLTATLLAIRGANQQDLDTSMELAAQAQARLMSTPEHEERISAFLSRSN